MRYLLDENLHESVARALDALNGPGERDDGFEHILDDRPAGTQDSDIPPLCREIGADALVTANVSDFGARLYYYQALLAENVHVVVLRPGRARLAPAMQIGIMGMNYPRMSTLLSRSEGPTLVKMTPSTCEPRTIEDLIEEIRGRASKLP